ncbi:MAG: mechanosensitive ion channel family protein [Pseudomonadota bacterium]|nr:mechanosensitive ion channel family protein [Pseudomonadota bacterium]
MLIVKGHARGDIARGRRYFSIPAALATAVLLSVIVAVASATDVTAVTVGQSEIPVEELEWLLKPLTVEELEVEADAWRDLLGENVSRIGDLQIELIRRNRELEAATEAEKAQNDTDRPDSAAAGQDPKETVEEARTEEVEEQKSEELEQLNSLREERTQIVDRMRLVVDAFEEKGGDAGKAEIYRKYIDAAAGLKVDVTDAQAAWATLQGWVLSSEGGLRWAKNIALFLGILIAFYLLARVLAKGAGHALAATPGASELLRKFLVPTIRRLTMIIGLLVGLAAMGINVGPLLAVIGAAGFVIAFALQSSLANFASGILILVFKPFDVGDAVDAGGVAGTVESVSLLSTHIRTFDNKAMIVPNNEIWGGVITNMTATGKRRVDMVFGIGYDDDIEKAQKILEEIVAAEALVLDDPAPVVRMNELADSSVNFVCRPWTNTGDYWEVYWNVQRAVKERFDAQGISIPYPQTDVHIHGLPAPGQTSDSFASGDRG